MQSSCITLKINGFGSKKIFDLRYTHPDEVYINKVKQERILSNYYFNETENEVKLIWNETITSCYHLFFECNEIKEIDLLYFDTSQIKQSKECSMDVLN